MGRTTWHATGLIVAVAVMATGGYAYARQQDPGVSKADPAEAKLIERIVELSAPRHSSRANTRQTQALSAVYQEALIKIDELFEQFPKTTFRDEALIIRLRLLAGLAHHTQYLRELLIMTDELGHRRLSPRLAEHRAYYALQAFVLGARAEGMPEEDRLAGSFERYEAFLEDYPRSEFAPVIWASLIRNAVAMKRIDRASRELAKLRARYPNHSATRRAEGELYQATAVGKPFAFAYTKPDGTEATTQAYLGKVLIVHFWASRSARSVTELPELVSLYNTYHKRGLELTGVNLDRVSEVFEAAVKEHGLVWPQYFDGKGVDNEAVVRMGVKRLPSYFLVDRQGILRAINPGDKLEETIDQLVGHSAPEPRHRDNTARSHSVTP